MTAFLTDDEIRHLTGLKLPTAQARFLKSINIPHIRNAAGRVIVYRCHFEHQEQSRDKEYHANVPQKKK